VAHARDWLGRARAFFAARGRGFTVYVREDRDAALAAACVEREMQPMHGSPGMVLDAKVPEKPLPAGTRIERIHDAAGLSDFVRVATPAYEMMSLPPGIAAAIFADARRVLTPDLAAYVAYVDGVPAATVLSLASHGIAGLYWVATHPDLQRRGLADAITRRASNAAFDAGAACVILQATRFGEPVYRRIGFREIARYAWYFVTRSQLETRGIVG
jgi:ribosomal protein S18 acetylase RimI-like enzyme